MPRLFASYHARGMRSWGCHSSAEGVSLIRSMRSSETRAMYKKGLTLVEVLKETVRL